MNNTRLRIVQVLILLFGIGLGMMAMSTVIQQQETTTSEFPVEETRWEVTGKAVDGNVTTVNLSLRNGTDYVGEPCGVQLEEIGFFYDDSQYNDTPKSIGMPHMCTNQTITANHYAKNLTFHPAGTMYVKYSVEDPDHEANEQWFMKQFGFRQVE